MRRESAQTPAWSCLAKSRAFFRTRYYCDSFQISSSIMGIVKEVCVR